VICAFFIKEEERFRMLFIFFKIFVIRAFFIKEEERFLLDGSRGNPNPGELTSTLYKAMT
jgi:hypothetical protein